MTKLNYRILTDRDPIALPEEKISGEGYLTLSARIARIGIQTYAGHELAGVDGDIDPDKIYRVYRPEEEVFAVDALESFAGLPVTLGHPAEQVSAENYQEFSVGHVLGQPVRDKDFVRAELTIRDAAAIEKIRNGDAAQLSVGYHADITLKPGMTPGGQSYDAVQTQIRGNHIALVDAARCGPQCAIGDQAVCRCAQCTTQNTQAKKDPIMSEIITLDGEQIPIAEAVEKLKTANAKIAEALQEAETTIDDLSARLETKSGEVEALKQKTQKPATSDRAFTDRVQARAKLISEARQILGDRTVVLNLTDAEIRRKVVNHIYGDKFSKGASENALMGMYRVAVRDALEASDTLNGRVAPTSNTNTFNQAAGRRKQHLSNAWKKGA